MPQSRYTLSVRYLSNERPFQTVYDPSPYGPQDDEAAAAWAKGMAETMGGMYTVVLLRDGEVVPPPSPAEGPHP